MSSISSLPSPSLGQPVARFSTREQSDRETLRLRVRTREGDTVDISVDASSLEQLTSGAATATGSTAAAATARESDHLSISLNIKGNLNDQELSDIQSLLQSLATGTPAASSLSSLESFQGSFSATSSVRETGLALYA